MRSNSLRWLLLATVIFGNCISWTFSRHHFRHYTSGHRSRPRRQGAKLFLPGTYVLPGGEGSGAWGPWGDPAPCSRTCGGGVSYQQRICLDTAPDGRKLCSGGERKYFSCNTQDCPEGSTDFRAEQCAQYNSVTFRGVTYDWVPYKKAPDACQLNCMPRGERFYYRHKEKVVDGTRCNDDSLDVCVDGVCQPVGCDLMLGSDAKEDKCRECRGNGTSCVTKTGVFQEPDLPQGYNDILLIPQGATQILISERRPSGNYLAIRSHRGNKYYLNGEYRIDFPRSLFFAGALWHYERSSQESYVLSRDIIRCQGPTTEPVYLQVLLLEKNASIDYEYSVPTALAQRPDEEYSWVFDQFTPCSASCGGGYQTRTVSCRSRLELNDVDDNLCDANLKPVSNQTCATSPCQARWVEGSWGPCSKPCGKGGSQVRQVYCEQVIANGLPTVVSDDQCLAVLGDKPALYRKCNEGSDCPQWYTGPWQPCDHLCGEGKQKRDVICHKKIDGRVEVLQESECEEQKPETEKSCQLHPCEGVDWVLSEWSGCDSCLSKVRTRTAQCATKDGVVYDASFCAYHPAPALQEDCDRAKLPPCDTQWYASQWSNCSAKCGAGVQTRRVFCGKFDGESILKVAHEQCDDKLKYNDTKPCDTQGDKCPADWHSGPWSECTKMCGGGEQFRRVVCLRGNVTAPDKDCDGDKFLDTSMKCNTQPCDEDETLPVSEGSTTVIDEDYDECEEGEEDEATDEEGEATEEPYPEEGLEEETSDSTASSTEGTDTTPTEEFMFSDMPSSSVTDLTMEGSGSDETPTAFTETDLTTGTGSGETELDVTGSTESSDATGSTATDETATTGTESTGSSTEVTSSTDAASSTTSSETESSSTESSTTGSESTDSSTTDSSTGSESREPTITSTQATEMTSDSTETGSTGSTDSESTGTETSTAGSETTGTEGTASTESEGTATTGTDVSTTEGTATTGTEGSTTEGTTGTEGSTTEGTTGTEGSTTEGTTGTEASTTEGTTGTEGSTTEGTTGTEGSTTEGTTGTEGSTTEATDGTEETATGFSTSWSPTEYAAKKHRKCKAKKPKCAASAFGCCFDNKTAAAGPFDAGCPMPETCKETKHGCCSDGVSPAMGPKDKGCPRLPCNETLYGCCKSDKKTPAKGNDQQGCPPPPPPCMASKFGCCADNKTEAKGPKRKGCPEKEPKPKGCKASKFGCCHDNATAASGPNGQGCPCNATAFGCCPDGISAAGGSQMEGCVMSCNSSAYGCCPDGETPAHGPQREGCCLAAPFGCCPDNINAARGPHLEGCSCEGAPYGCCPDNVTIAKGYGNEGCDCKYSEHGCCPNRIDRASGPNFEGCPCHTYQFGCCADGKTAAKGPQQQGCRCIETQFGCCGDGVTAAQGANQTGCDCSTSKYGCCPDGQTEAKGDKFFGCTDAPKSLQVSCKLDKDRGTACKNYSVHWYYDMEYGGCSRFWYGGCDGNDNRFPSQPACEDACVKPQGKDVCKLPKVKGVCEGYFPRWYYDAEREYCTQFVYGGCLGNKNNFENREDCQTLCEPARSKDACALPIDTGSCAGNYPRWGFNPETRRCEQFVWGGCEGNQNRFVTEEACVLKCDAPGTLKAECKLPRAEGNCTDKQAKWYYNEGENRCVPFYYTGCGGNENQFRSEQDCDERCPKVVVQDTCTLPALIGDCADYTERWFFDSALGRCRQFYYGGCGGNGNNFRTERECARRCSEPATTPRPTTPYRAPAQPTQPAAQIDSRHPEADRRPGTEFDTANCFAELERGQCDRDSERWGFDARRGECTTFTYGGCGGNRNNFPTREHCQYYCRAAQDVCQLPMMVGPCDASEMQFYYDRESDSCNQFTYGGCGGNGNRFGTREDCERRCKSGQPEVQTTTRRAPEPEYQQPEPSESVECSAPPSTEPCGEEALTWHYDERRGGCIPSMMGNCRYPNTYGSEEACERKCGIFKEVEVCRYPVDAGVCDDGIDRTVLKYYWDAERGCTQFNYSGCAGGPNRFSTRDECAAVCAPHPAEPDHSVANNEIPEPCDSYRDECARIRCEWGVDERKTEEGCVRCTCRHPCAAVSCPEGERCALRSYRGPAGDRRHSTTCRPINKSGSCPNLAVTAEPRCDRQCNDDADCADEHKCCRSGCSDVCVAPQPDTEPRYSATYPARQYAPTSPAPYRESLDTLARADEHKCCRSGCSDVCVAPQPDTEPRYSATYPARQYAPTSPAPYRESLDTLARSDEHKCCRSGCSDVCVAPQPDTEPRYSATYPARQYAPTSPAPYRESLDTLARADEHKCCRSGCSDVCVAPQPDTEPRYSATYPARQYAPTSPAPYRESLDTLARSDEHKCCRSGCSDVCVAPQPDTEPRYSATYPARQYAPTSPAPYRESLDTLARSDEHKCCRSGCSDVCVAPQPDTEPRYSATYPARQYAPTSPAPYRESLDTLARADEHKCCSSGCSDVCVAPQPDTEPRYSATYPARQYAPTSPAPYRESLDTLARADEHKCCRSGCSDVCVAPQPDTEPRYSATYPARQYAPTSPAPYRESLDTLARADEHKCCRSGCSDVCVAPQPDTEPRYSATYPARQYAPTSPAPYRESLDTLARADEHKCCRSGCSDVCVALQPDTEPRYSATYPARQYAPTSPAPYRESLDTLARADEHKCCRSGCSDVCVAPQPDTEPRYSATYPARQYAPTSPAPYPSGGRYLGGPRAPEPAPESEPETTAEEGGVATLRCLFNGNPPPTVTWQRGEIVIDGQAGRYRVLTDGALQIVSVYRNDSGVYICIGDNGVGEPSRQEVRLDVKDPVAGSAGIMGEQDASVTGTLGQTVTLRCLAYGHPPPIVQWWKGKAMLPYSSDALEQTKDHSIIIRNLTLESLGVYTCQSYNGVDKPSSWSITVRAYRPPNLYIENPYLVDLEGRMQVTPALQPTSITYPPVAPETEPVVYNVPISTTIKSERSTWAVGSDLSLLCVVDGYPTPRVQWSKDGVPLEQSERVEISDVHRLTINRVSVNDSGIYTCQAANAYSSHYSTIQVNVEGVHIPPTCNDNPFFANCTLIVRARFCRHHYYSQFCCMSCTLAGQISIEEMYADDPGFGIWKKK